MAEEPSIRSCRNFHAKGLVPRYPLQKPPSRGLEGSGGEGGGGGTKVWRSKGASPSEGFKASKGLEGGLRGLQGGLKGASRGLQGGFTFGREGFKGAWKGLQGGFKGAWRGLKPSEGEGGFERLEGVKGAWRGLQGGFTFGRLQRGLKVALRGLQGGLKGAWSLPKVKGASWRGLEEASKGLEGGLKGAAFSAEAGFEDACKGALHQRFGHV